jgi:hypothetical protein
MGAGNEILKKKIEFFFYRDLQLRLHGRRKCRIIRRRRRRQTGFHSFIYLRDPASIFFIIILSAGGGGGRQTKSPYIATFVYVCIHLLIVCVYGRLSIALAGFASLERMGQWEWGGGGGVG